MVWLFFPPFFFFPIFPFAVAAVALAASLVSAMVAGWSGPTLFSNASVFPFALVSAFWVPEIFWRVAAFFAAAFVSVLVAAFLAAFRAHGSGF